ncbi:DNA-binding LacI/PurR family transcriptional regulator [Pullulanibacillus pueri]|uniref:LacI family transcriptional regulator n=1 Tax=Pullulanibacillus pueri TaxID=1437324 RepID=A0A8J2ZVN4_9BACL|nr:LacI family DNA-binding transcriptional regulator [Pullulanibacillus pueri]MBM7682070.1 DNA-binding LacI/PurR family transcriptional regulator [Pullulanibacillus pueri]GGH80097.1 LacI family transcriptional regulator [Pullulanibacillus pueri]
MAITIKDVAKQAGVAPSTVSRVISDSPRISMKTKRKVRKVMEELGFHINHNARNLVQQKTRNIGIVMKNSSSESLHDPFFPEVLRGISAWCNKEDFSISLTTGETEETIFKDVVKMVQGKQVDGIIVLYSKKDDKVVPYLSKSGIPFVVIGRPFDTGYEMMYVDNDNVLAAKSATEYLIKLGHKNIGYIGGELDFEVAKFRLQGFKEAMLLHHLSISESKIKNPEMSRMDEAVKELMDSDSPPTALLVIDDLSALSVLSVLKERNIKVPEEVSIVSFNNTIISKITSPALTSVDTQIFQLGFESARCLIEEINEPSQIKKSVIIPTIFVERESTKPIYIEKGAED